LKRVILAVFLLPLMASFAHADHSIDKAISDLIKPVVDPIVSTVFYSVPIFDTSFPLIVGWLVVAAAVVFTVYLGFIQFRGFKHSIELVRNEYLDPKDAGEVTPFQALATALSGTDGRRTHGDLGLWEVGQINSLKQIATFLSQEGAVPGIQLGHAGWKASERRP
tara:strand:+ start:3041 stop:3535 length:495 start_codon:yes stop_codon:yes gene_type:complete